MHVKTSVVVPTHNNAARLVVTLRALGNQTLPGNQYELLVVNNGSTDETISALEKLNVEIPHLRCTTEPAVGRSNARNRGIREACGEIIVFLDDDIIVQPDFLERHLGYHRDSTESLVVVGKVEDISPIRPFWLQDYFHVRQYAGSPHMRAGCDWLYFATGNASLKRQTLEAGRVADVNPAAYFDPVFNVREDGELGYRLGRSGARFVFAEDIVAQHYHPRTLRTVLERSYEIGWGTARLIQKHPETAASSTQHLTTSRLIKFGLLVVCVLSFAPTFFLRSIWREPFRKVTGALLQYQRIRGYQDARNQLKHAHGHGGM